AGDRKLRLFACACCDHIRARMPDARQRRMVREVRAFADAGRGPYRRVWDREQEPFRGGARAAVAAVALLVEWWDGAGTRARAAGRGHTSGVAGSGTRCWGSGERDGQGRVGRPGIDPARVPARAVGPVGPYRQRTTNLSPTTDTRRSAYPAASSQSSSSSTAV